MRQPWRAVVCVAALVVGGSPGSARADIAPDPEYGTSLAPWGPCGVRMLDEHVTLRMGPERVDVKAVFTLVNGEAPSRLRVGFPEAVRAGMWSSDEHTPPTGATPRMRDFVARVDGKVQEATPRYFQQGVGPFVRTELAELFRQREAAIEQAATPEEKARLQAELDAKRGEFGWWSSSGWLVWEMTFEPRQKRSVEVTYHSPYLYGSSDPVLPLRNFRYILTSGAFWDGTIGEAIVDVVAVDGVLPSQLARLAPEGAVRTATGARWTWKDLEPDFDIGIDVGDPDLAAAALAHRAAAEKILSRPALDGEARRLAGWYLGLAYFAYSDLKRWADAVQACRDILAQERALAAAGADASPRAAHIHVSRSHRLWFTPHVPWEFRLVEALERTGDAAATRAAALAVLPVLRRWVAEALAEPDEEKAASALKAMVERCEVLAGAAEAAPQPQAPSAPETPVR